MYSHLKDMVGNWQYQTSSTRLQHTGALFREVYEVHQLPQKMFRTYALGAKMTLPYPSKFYGTFSLTSVMLN